MVEGHKPSSLAELKALIAEYTDLDEDDIDDLFDPDQVTSFS